MEDVVLTNEEKISLLNEYRNLYVESGFHEGLPMPFMNGGWEFVKAIAIYFFESLRQYPNPIKREVYVFFLEYMEEVYKEEIKTFENFPPLITIKSIISKDYTPKKRVKKEHNNEEQNYCSPPMDLEEYFCQEILFILKKFAEWCRGNNKNFPMTEYVESIYTIRIVSTYTVIISEQE